MQDIKLDGNVDSAIRAGRATLTLENGGVMSLVRQIEDSISSRQEPRWAQNNTDHDRFFKILDSVRESLVRLESAVSTLNANQAQSALNIDRVNRHIEASDSAIEGIRNKVDTSDNKVVTRVDYNLDMSRSMIWRQTILNCIVVLIGSGIAALGVHLYTR